MAKLYATLETSKGKTVSVSDNEEIIATVYDGNMKAYSVHISWTDIGDIDISEPDEEEDPLEERTMGAIITTREWRNEPEERRKVKATGKVCQIHGTQYIERHKLDGHYICRGCVVDSIK